MTITPLNSHAASNTLLPACKSSPNCVSSQAEDAEHLVAPFKLVVNPEIAWEKLRLSLLAEGMLIVHDSNQSLHAEATSKIFRFVDDIHAILDTQAKLIHIYSASRVGYSDFGVNRKRVETIRQQLQQAGVIE